MSKSLVIVESPAKAKTIGKYLGKNFTVKASLGHVKDLPKNDIAVDVERSFRPTYVVIEGKKKLIDELKKAAKDVDAIYLAADRTARVRPSALICRKSFNPSAAPPPKSSASHSTRSPLRPSRRPSTIPGQ